MDITGSSGKQTAAEDVAHIKNTGWAVNLWMEMGTMENITPPLTENLKSQL